MAEWVIHGHLNVCNSDKHEFSMVWDGGCIVYMWWSYTIFIGFMRKHNVDKKFFHSMDEREECMKWKKKFYNNFFLYIYFRKKDIYTKDQILDGISSRIDFIWQ